MEGLYLRNQTWWLRFRPAPKAAQVRLNLRTTDEVAAIVEARKILARPHQFTATASTTDWVARYIDHKKKSGCTPWWAGCLRHCLEEAAGYFDPSPRRITREQVETWRAALISADRVYRGGRGKKKPPVNERTAATYALWVRPFFAWLIEKGVILRSPFEGVQIPKTSPAVRKVFMTREQADLALNTRTATNKEHADQLRFCLFAGLHAGLRKAEVIACRPQWFDLRSGLLHLQNESDFLIKDRENRTIPLTPQFLAFLQEYGLRSPYLLAPDVKHGRVPYRFDFRAWFANHMLALGLERFTFHDLRRTFASLHASHGTPLFHIARWLGDDPSIVERTYAHLVPAHDRINGPWETPVS